MDSLLRAGQTQQGPGQLMVDNHRHFDRFAAATRHHNLPRQIGKPKQQILFSDPIKWMIKSLFFGVNLRLYFRFCNSIFLSLDKPTSHLCLSLSMLLYFCLFVSNFYDTLFVSKGWRCSRRKTTIIPQLTCAACPICDFFLFVFLNFCLVALICL